MSEDGTDNLFPVSKMDLLWENASPTSAFAAQTISLNLADYDAILVRYNGSGYQNVVANTTRCDLFFIGGGDGMLIIPTFTNIFGTRQLTVSTTGIVFSTGYHIAGSTNSANNYAAVPMKIYGIKIEI